MTGLVVQGVVFDLDGTLYTLAAPKLRLTLSLARDLGLLRRLSSARKSLRGSTFDNREALVCALADRLGHQTGVPASHVLRWYEERFYPAFVDMLRRSATPRPGVDALLMRLRLRGVKIAVYSDYDQIPERLRALGLDPGAFDELISAEGCGVVKPASAPLVALLEKWGLAAQQAIMVGDRQDLDARSAAQCGLRYLGLGNLPRRLIGSGSWHAVVRQLDLLTQGSAAAPH